MGLRPSSEEAIAFDPGVIFRTLKGATADVPREWEPSTVLFEGVSPEEWRSLEVALNGRPLPTRLELHGAGERVTAAWDRASSGSWLLEVRLGGGRWSRLLHVRPAKLGDAAFASMLEDLESGLPASIAMGLDRLGAFAGVDWRPPRMVTLAQEIEHVRRALADDGERPGLIRTLYEVARDPHAVLAEVHPWLLAERARRPSPARLPAAFGKAGNVMEGGQLIKVMDARVAHSFDVYENRLLRTFTDQAEARLRRLRRWLANSPAVGPEIREEMARLATELAKARRAAFFLDAVGRLRSAPTRLTMVLLRKPPYRAGLEGFLAFQRSAGVQVSHPALDAPLENVPFLYEAWGTLTLITALLDAADEEGMRVTSQRLHSWSEGGAVSLLPGDEPAVTLQGADGRMVTLTPQRPFPRRGARGFRSVSYEQIPDVTVEVRRGGQTSLFIFDPKYKLFGDAEGLAGDGRPKKEDIDKMHSYRDAIRDPAGDRPVRLAAILYPGPEEWFGDGVAALSAMPGGNGFRSATAMLLREIISADGGRWGVAGGGR